MQRPAKLRSLFYRWESLAAIVPAYDDDFQPTTRFYFTDGSTLEVLFPIESVMREFFAYFAVSQKQLHQTSARHLGDASRKIPLSIQKDLCLLPIKCLEDRISRKHQQNGYIVAQQISRVLREPNNAATILFQRSGLCLYVPQSPRTIKRQRDMASILIARFQHY